MYTRTLVIDKREKLISAWHDTQQVRAIFFGSDIVMVIEGINDVVIKENGCKKENPTGWRLWGLHRDGYIDRFLKPMSLYGLFCLTYLCPTKSGTYAHAIYASNCKQVGEWLLININKTVKDARTLLRSGKYKANQ